MFERISCACVFIVIEDVMSSRFRVCVLGNGNRIYIQQGVMSVDVAIIGAGISGLSAARILSNSGCKSYKIFEASSRVGGRTFCDAEGTDLGGAYFGPTQDRIIAIIDELGLKLEKVNTLGKTVQIVRGVRKYYEGTIPPVSILGTLDLNAAMMKFDKLASVINMKYPHLSEQSEYLDGMTAEELIRNTAWTSDAKAILRTGIRAILCVEPSQLSALYLVWYIAQSGGCRRIFETKDGAQDAKVRGGAGLIAPLLAQKYANGPDKISLNTPIRSMEDDPSGNGVLIHGTDGLLVHAKCVIMAIPPVQMLRIQYTPSLSAQRFQSLQRWPMGCICKTFMYYDKDFWTPLGLSGAIVTDEGPVCVSFADTRGDGSRPCIMGFVLAAQASALSSPQERRLMICEHYAKCFGTVEALCSVDYKEKMWAEEQWVGGCYVGTVGPGVLTTCMRCHCDPFWGGEDSAIAGEGHVTDKEIPHKKVFIAGTEAAWLMVGYMDGAVESGERAARNALVHLGMLPSSEYDKISQPGASVQMPHVEMTISTIEKYFLPTVGQVVGIVVVAAGVLWGVMYHKSSVACPYL